MSFDLESLSSLLWKQVLNLSLNQQVVVSTHKRLCTGTCLCPHAGKIAYMSMPAKNQRSRNDVLLWPVNHDSRSLQFSIYLERTGLYQTKWVQVAHLLAGVRRLVACTSPNSGVAAQIVGHLCCDHSNAIASLVSAKLEASSPRSTACGTC